MVFTPSVKTILFGKKALLSTRYIAGLLRSFVEFVDGFMFFLLFQVVIRLFVFLEWLFGNIGLMRFWNRMVRAGVGRLLFVVSLSSVGVQLIYRIALIIGNGWLCVYFHQRLRGRVVQMRFFLHVVYVHLLALMSNFLCLFHG